MGNLTDMQKITLRLITVKGGDVATLASAILTLDATQPQPTDKLDRGGE